MNSALQRVFKPLASMKLTVVLFALSIFLVFAGTVAQIDKGIWTVVSEYFRCNIAWIDLYIFFPRDWNVPGGFYYPGGWLIGSLLLANLLAAHSVRFKVAASGPRLFAGILVLAVGVLLTWLVLAGVLTKEVAATEGDAFWRVLWRLAKGGVAALVLCAGCWLAFKKRAGIVLLHSGIILLLLSELVTGVAAVEGSMRIEEGKSANYIYHTRAVELAFVDVSATSFDQVVVVPGSLLRREGLIEDEQLPVDIEVLEYMKNSRLADVEMAGLTPQVSSGSNRATVGHGLRFMAVEASEASGTDVNQKVDTPSAYVTLKKKGTDETLGTYLVSLRLSPDNLQTFSVGERSYNLSLRFKRTYKPYTIHLLDFRHDRYLGTEKPKNFSSLVRLVDPEKEVDREVNIWMNNPLRYRGETFYQASFEPGDKVTILQVVRNVGWMAPYVACMIVGTGLATHFGIHLLGFLRRRRSA